MLVAGLYHACAQEMAGQPDAALAAYRRLRPTIPAQSRYAGEADAAMDTLVAELNVAIEHHVKEERDELFPKAKAAPELDLQALGEQLRERQQDLQSEAAMPA